eukprot:866866-Rhodomonas_salina.1
MNINSTILLPLGRQEFPTQPLAGLAGAESESAAAPAARESAAASRWRSGLRVGPGPGGRRLPGQGLGAQ